MNPMNNPGAWAARQSADAAGRARRAGETSAHIARRKREAQGHRPSPARRVVNLIGRLIGLVLFLAVLAVVGLIFLYVFQRARS